MSIRVSRVHISAPGQPSTPKKPAQGGGVYFPADYFDRCNTPPSTRWRTRIMNFAMIIVIWHYEISNKPAALLQTSTKQADYGSRNRYYQSQVIDS